MLCKDATNYIMGDSVFFSYGEKGVIKKIVKVSQKEIRHEIQKYENVFLTDLDS